MCAACVGVGRAAVDDCPLVTVGVGRGIGVWPDIAAADDCPLALAREDRV